MKNWLQENWFKLVILLLIGIFVVFYSYDVYNQNQPKNLKEKIWQELQKR